MSKYDKDTKFYWLVLKEDFFEDDAIQWLEEQQPNGRDYAYFYLKLCLKSLKTNGILIRNVGDILIPYDNKKLADLTKMDFDTVTIAMELLKKIGLVKILENGEIYISQLEKLIGSKSIGALKKQQQRMISRQQEDICLPKIELNIEQELNINNNNISSTKKVDEKLFEQEFERLWNIYPKKQGKKDALKHFIKARKENIDFDIILNGLEKYNDYIKNNNISAKYIKQGSTWFNQECWNDDYNIQEPNNEHLTNQQKVMIELERLQKVYENEQK